jgi:nitronate monooxygenase
VNIWLHDDVRRPPNLDTIPADIFGAAQDVLNEFRPRLDLEPQTRAPKAPADVVDAAIEVMIEEQIPVFSSGLGVPEAALVERFHQAGTKVLTMVASLEDAILAAKNGVDAVIAQGAEAGGHRSFGSKVDEAEAGRTSLLALLPEVVDTLGDSTPVIAAGGIADGRGVAAALTLGACGALLGTRFVATVESMANDAWKQTLVEQQPELTITDGYTGQWARVVKTEFTETWKARGMQAPPGLLQSAMMRDLHQAAKQVGDTNLQPLYAGTSARLINDLPHAGQVVLRINDELRHALTSALRELDSADSTNVD